MANKPVSSFNPNLAALQDGLTENLDKLGINSNEHLGNSTTGKSDGRMGERTSRALEKLVLLAQLDAGVKAENAKSDYTRENIQHIENYLKKRGLDEASVAKITTNLAAVTLKDGDKPSVMDSHYSTGQVDVKALKVPESPKPAEAPKPSPDSAKADFDKVGPPAPEKKPEPPAAAPPAPPAPPVTGKTISMTHDEYEKIKEKLDDGDIVSREDRDAAKAFEKAYDKLKADTGYDKVKADLDVALERQNNPSKLRNQLKDEKTTLENSVQTKIDKYEATKFTVEVEIDGKKQTFEDVSKDQLDEKYGWRWNDGETARKVRDAVDAEINKLKDADPTFRADEKKIDVLKDNIRDFYTDTQTMVRELKSDINKRERDLENRTLSIFVPDPAPAAAPAASAPVAAAAKP